MRSTLFFIPHEIAGMPLFGFGLLFWGIVVSFASWAFWTYQRTKNANEALGSLPVFGIAAGMVAFLLPRIEQVWPDGTPIGLPIRGYGILVVSGLIAGIAISVYRGRQLGVASDFVIGLGFWMMMIGVLGARVFYVVQKWEEFDSIGKMFQVTEGGLVIYGGVIGGLVAAVGYCLIHKQHMLAVADLVAPGFLIGLAFGRIGCLLHGCCFGGVCDANLPVIYFPHGSIPYQAQVVSGRLLGLEINPESKNIDVVTPDSPAASLGLEAGGKVDGIGLREIEPKPGSDPAAPPEIYAEASVDGQPFSFFPNNLPDSSLPTHPSQIYSAINALLLCMLVWFLQPIPRRDGIAFCSAIILYGTSRFLLEWVRSDEGGQLGTQLTISQLVSLGLITASVLAIVWIRTLPESRFWPWNPNSAAA